MGHYESDPEHPPAASARGIIETSGTGSALALNFGGPSGHPEDLAELSGGVPLGRYFDLGKFRDEPGAQEAANGLTKDGFHTVVVQRIGFWTTFYHVLVGPYGNEAEAEAARGKLRSNGFTPRNLPQKPRTLLLLPRTSSRAEAVKPVGSLVVAWEAYSPDAIVKLVKQGRVVETAQAKWVSREAPYRHNNRVPSNGSGFAKTSGNSLLRCQANLSLRR